jgi:anthraniloyl-CoA monooxygenase
VVSPMATYSATDGVPNDFHFVHYGSRAQGGAAFVFTEMTCVTPEGRITLGCPGMYSDEQERAWKRIVDFVHENTPCKIGMQLGHSGPKGATHIPWQGSDEEPIEGAWELVAPSAIAWCEKMPAPHALNRDEMEEIKQAFVSAAERAERAGFDMLELHCAHGYLLSAFITPLSNKRQDEYGGSLENRLRYSLEVFTAIRGIWPKHKPMSVRISATDWVEGEDSVTADEAIEIARAFHNAGVDMINVSAGQTSTKAKPVYGRMFQTPFSDRIRNEAGIATLAVGNIYEFDHVNSIIAAGRADLCCLARPHLADPYWTLHAAAQQNYRGVTWPNQYLTGRNQLYRNLQRAAEMATNV